MELSPRTPQSFRSDQPVALSAILSPEILVWLSDDMLLLDLDIFELKEYLTDAERAGSFYIKTSDYINPLFDMCVQHTVACDNLGPL
jgi:hypothetical protein